MSDRGDMMHHSQLEYLIAVQKLQGESTGVCSYYNDLFGWNEQLYDSICL